jgi:uncharacterized protein involved in response to NO
VQGGTGVGVSAHRRAGTVAGIGAVGTIASVDLRRHHPGLTAATAHADKADVDAAGLLFGVPHRFFFLGGVAQLALASLWWAWSLAARAFPVLAPLPAAVPEVVLHAVLMLYGFAPLFMFGFLFTAGPRWLGVPAPAPAAWRLPGLLAVAGALLLLPAQLVAPLADSAGAVPIRAAAALFALGWLGLTLRFVLLIGASAAQDRVHARLLAIALATGWSGIASFALFGATAYPWIKLAGLWGFLLPVFVVVCHRMIPFFSASALPFVTAFRPWGLLAAMVGAPLAHGGLTGLGADAWTWMVDLPAGVLTLWLCLRWGLSQSLRNRLLAMLHLGFVWFGFGFVLLGVQSLIVLSGGSGAPLAPLHALTIGFAASLLMAMVTRVTCGHSGRALAADDITWRLFQLLQVAALTRIAADLVPGAGWLALAALLWAASFLPWCLRYAPVYWRPRPDGRPG